MQSRGCIKTCQLMYCHTLQPAAYICSVAAGSNAKQQQKLFLVHLTASGESHLRAKLQVIISQNLHERSLAEIDKTHSVGRPAVTLDHCLKVTS